MDDFTFPISINYDQVGKDRGFAPFVRLLALDLIDNPYITIGTFIQNISDDDLSNFLDLIEEDEDTALGNVVILAEMLSQAEGLRSDNLDELTEKSNTLLTYLVMESLRRKGVVRIFYNNMSFGDEFTDKVIVERIQ